MTAKAPVKSDFIVSLFREISVIITRLGFPRCQRGATVTGERHYRPRNHVGRSEKKRQGWPCPTNRKLPNRSLSSEDQHQKQCLTKRTTTRHLFYRFPGVSTQTDGDYN